MEKMKEEELPTDWHGLAQISGSIARLCRSIQPQDYFGKIRSRFPLIGSGFSQKN